MTSIQTHLCFLPPLLSLTSSSHLALSSWMVNNITSLLCVLKGFSMVRYPFCSLPCTLAKEVQLILGLGFYSGILTVYFQCQSNESTGRTATIIFYAICVLYLLSTVNFVIDLVSLIFDVTNNSKAAHRTILWLQLYFYKISCYLYCRVILKKLNGTVRVKKQVYMFCCAEISKVIK